VREGFLSTTGFGLLSSCLKLFIDSELGSRVGFETLVWDGRPAAGRISVSAVGEPTLGPVEGRKTVAQLTGDGVITRLGCETFRRIAQVARLIGRCTVLLGIFCRFLEQRVHPPPF
jgi:hypothetical protein